MRPQISITVIHLGRFSWWTKSEWLTAALAAQAVLLVFRWGWGVAPGCWGWLLGLAATDTDGCCDTLPRQLASL